VSRISPLQGMLHSAMLVRTDPVVKESPQYTSPAYSRPILVFLLVHRQSDIARGRYCRARGADDSQGVFPCTGLNALGDCQWRNSKSVWERAPV